MLKANPTVSAPVPKRVRARAARSDRRMNCSTVEEGRLDLTIVFMNESCCLFIDAVKRSLDYVFGCSRCLARAPTSLLSVPTLTIREAVDMPCLCAQTFL